MLKIQEESVMGVKILISLIAMILIYMIDYIKRKEMKEVVIRYSKFGRLQFKKNLFSDNENDLISYNQKIRFGKSNPTIQLKDYQKEKLYVYLHALNYIHEIQNEIVENMCKEALDYCQRWFKLDEDGNPVRYEYIWKSFDVDTIILKIENSVVMAIIRGFCDGLIDDQDIVVYINCTDKEIVKYSIEE